MTFSARALFLLLSSLALGSCFLCPKKTTTVEKIVVHEVTVPCLKTPLAPLDPVPAPTECMPGLVCYPVVDMNTFAANVEKLLDRVDSDWDLCGPPPTTQP
jgi:hypothetical protein